MKGLAIVFLLVPGIAHDEPSRFRVVRPPFTPGNRGACRFFEIYDRGKCVGVIEDYSEYAGQDLRSGAVHWRLTADMMGEFAGEEIERDQVYRIAETYAMSGEALVLQTRRMIPIQRSESKLLTSR